MAKLAVERMDNRGNSEVRYGFIYFNDGRRVTYMNDEVHDGTGGWAAVTKRHLTVAQQYLADHPSGDR